MLAYESIPNLPTLFFERAAHFNDIPFLWAKIDNRWRPSTWKQVADRVAKFAYGLKQLGVKPGDRVLLVAENRPEWMISDLAIMSIGAVAVPAYTTNTVGNHRHIINDSGATLAICSVAELSQRVMQAAAGSDLKTLITMEWPGSLPQGLKLHGWDDVLGMAERAKSKITADALAEEARSIKRDTMAAIIYTSGTSAEPTGVMLSHGNMLCNVMGAEEFLHTLPGLEEGKEVFLSFLPLSHSYEHTVGQFVPISIGAQVYYAESIEKLAQNIIEVQPTIMTAVPRLYENIRAKILRGAASVGGLKEKMLLRTVELGSKRYEDPTSLTLLERIQDAALTFLVRRKVTKRFGGRLKAFVSGGAPLNYDVGLFFLSLGQRILQGYGQTESAPVVSVNRVEMNDLRTVGPPLLGVEVKIAEDGEILVRGELVMLGYWNSPERTAQTIIDGWLHTGDIGELDSKGRIRITDRKKDIIVNSGGDNISPQRIEGVIALQPEIGQVMVYGDKRPHIVALVVPDPDWVKEWRRSNGKGSGSDWRSLLDDPTFEKAVRAAVDRANGELSVIERVRRTLIAEEAFSVENGMLTPSMKCRRHIVKQTYQDRLEALYGKG
ncbi:MAG: AMP-dependent synthetase/ligase [Alphaproteobacteria bacterium]|nr:AMP-dependent synthetase/ligase [Alphaproteobacteria bacterium]